MEKSWRNIIALHNYMEFPVRKLLSSCFLMTIDGEEKIAVRGNFCLEVETPLFAAGEIPIGGINHQTGA